MEYLKTTDTAKNKTPNVFWHMTTWGAVSGMVLAILFLIFLDFVLDAHIGDVFSDIFVFLIVAFIFGGLPGAFLGFSEAFFVGALHNIPLPFTKENIEEIQWAIYRGVIPIPIVFSVILSIFTGIVYASLSAFILYWFIFGIPTFIASIASIYIAHRYMLRICMWSESLYGRKSKTKNEEYYRLMDDETQAEEITSETENVEQRSQQ